MQRARSRGKLLQILVGDYLFTDADFINSLSVNHRNVFEKIYDEIKYLCKVATAGSKEAKELEKIKKLFAEAYRTETKNTTQESDVSVNASGNAKYSISSKFYEQLDNWDGKTIGFSFVVGETSKALQIAGIPKKQIRWDASKIATLLKKHNGMTIETVKGIPELLENPVIVIDSKKNDNSKIVMGELYDKNGKVVTAVLLLTPTSKKGNILDLVKISSAEGRSHINSLFVKEDGTSVPVRYKDEKRIQSWLNVNRLQLPLHNLDMDSNNIIPQNREKASENSKISLDKDEIKVKQLDIILENNPAYNTYSTWIRDISDIKTFEETLQDSDWADWKESGFDPDYTSDMVQKALDSGKITVYSSYPIEQGVFVTPSRMEAQSYSANGKVYSKTIDLKDVAWIDPTQGQYAKVLDDDIKASLSDDLAPVAPTGTYNVYGKDVELAPVRKNGVATLPTKRSSRGEVAPLAIPGSSFAIRLRLADHFANPCSLHPPPAALAGVAPAGSRRSGSTFTFHQSKKSTPLGHPP